MSDIEKALAAIDGFQSELRLADFARKYANAEIDLRREKAAYTEAYRDALRALGVTDVKAGTSEHEKVIEATKGEYAAREAARRRLYKAKHKLISEFAKEQSCPIRD
ncbi:MAG: hypothetical protein IKD58_14400 [Loktanella sp.]|nr:hypothetical protein [Loktanella sp.]